MASSDVSSSVLGILGAYSCGLDIFKKLRCKDKSRRRRNNRKANALELQLSSSLRNGPAEIQLAFSHGYQFGGDRFAIGDSSARTALKDILFKLNSGLVATISHLLIGAKEGLHTDYRALIMLSECCRKEALGALKQLQSRLSEKSHMISRKPLPKLAQGQSSSPPKPKRKAESKTKKTAQDVVKSASASKISLAKPSPSPRDQNQQRQFALVRPHYRHRVTELPRPPATPVPRASRSTPNISSSNKTNTTPRVPAAAPCPVPVPAPAPAQTAPPARPSTITQPSIARRPPPSPIHTRTPSTPGSPPPPYASFDPAQSSHSLPSSRTSSWVQAQSQAMRRTSAPSPAAMPPAYTDHAPQPQPQPQTVPRVENRVSIYTTTTDSTKIGEIPLHRWPVPWDWDAASVANREAERTGWPREEAIGQGQGQRRRGLWGFLRKRGVADVV